MTVKKKKGDSKKKEVVVKISEKTPLFKNGMRTFERVASQGDCTFVRCDSLPPNLTKIEPQGNGGLLAEGNHHVVVAHSETGHHHVFTDPSIVQLWGTGRPELSYLEVKEDAPIVHLRQEHQHGTFLFQKGVYEIHRQRERFPEGWRLARD